MTTHRRLVPLVIALLLVGACATSGTARPPDVAVAQVGTDVLRAATLLQTEVNHLTATGLLPPATGQRITDANKIVSVKAGQLATALRAYHAATSPAARLTTVAEVQALIADLSGPLAQMFGAPMPTGLPASVSRLIGGVMAAVAAVQAEVAKGLSGRVWSPQFAIA